MPAAPYIARLAAILLALTLESCTAPSSVDTPVHRKEITILQHTNLAERLHVPLCGFSMWKPSNARIVEKATDRARIELPVPTHTNLIEKYVEIECRTDEQACTGTDDAQEISHARQRSIHGVNYWVQQGEDVAAGSLYAWQRYTTKRNNHCLRVTFVLHSAQKTAYSSPISYYETRQEQTVFEKMAQSFRLDP